ncbi:SLAM family member 9-like isoform X3 [Hemicordylus capensis]|uniref:SLAM family member 9-like isoform X3 n=1 Tax=Hemicordylus capensis TaxID=884348 RepID=UPI00230451BD|nr:SLAM family member 9-like isoform X3 [Hemicordylus capensis]
MTSQYLKITLLFGTLVCTFRGTICNPLQNPSPYAVNGVLGGTALLHISSAKKVVRTEWGFQNKSNVAFVIAEFRDGDMERPNPSDRFGKRLERLNVTTLRIKDLVLDDSGIYRAHARFDTAVNEDYTFNLTVHKPVPEPKISHHLISNASAGCNVTLKCQVPPGKGDFKISWKRGNPLGTLEGISDWYRVSASGTDLHLLWQPSNSDSTFTCLVSNPADQKSISFDLLSICPNEAENQAVISTMPKEANSPNLQYAEISKKRNPPEGGDDQVPDHLYPCLEQKPPTIYAMLQTPACHSEQIT